MKNIILTLAALTLTSFTNLGCQQSNSGSSDLSSTSGQPKYIDIVSATAAGYNTSRQKVLTSLQLNTDNSFSFKETYFDTNGSGEKCEVQGTWSVSDDYNLRLNYTNVNGSANSGTLSWDLLQLNDVTIRYKINSSISTVDLVRESVLENSLTSELPDDSSYTTNTACLHL